MTQCSPRSIPITVEVVRNASSPMPTRWRRCCRKTAYNMMIYEVRDYCCGLDRSRRRRMISQNRGGLPIFLADLGVAVVDGMRMLWAATASRPAT